MERIRLTKREKALLRAVAEGGVREQKRFTDTELSALAYRLESVGLVRAAWAEGPTVIDIALTRYGKYYLGTNPKLRNPVPRANWAAISAFVCVIWAALSVLLLFSILGIL